LVFSKVTEILEKYNPSIPPPEVMIENYELFFKAREIVVRRATELFTRVMPCLCGIGEVETWFFNQFFYNFLLDYAECLKVVFKRSEKEREDFLSFLKENDWLNKVFKIHPFDPTTFGLWAISLGWDDLKRETKHRKK